MNNIKLPSNKSFGIVFFVFFLIIAIWPISNGENLKIWPLFLSLIFLVLGLLNSNILTPFNKIWMKFGLFLGMIISPIVMGIIFFCVVTPIALCLKLFKKDILKLKKNNDYSYWETKDNSKNNMKNQF